VLRRFDKNQEVVMKKNFANLLISAGLFFTAPSFAFDTHNMFTTDTVAQKCYGNAMVGFDSVINSRLGVPPEHALDLARMGGLSAASENVYATELLDYIYNAYLWNGSPHSYAVSVFYRCAQRNAGVHQARSD
jgi:hypothetical protein